jgi:AcrR family transcriptional regulator
MAGSDTDWRNDPNPLIQGSYEAQKQRLFSKHNSVLPLAKNGRKLKIQAPPTNDRILRAASELFSDLGFAGTSTREIADRVGITQPGLYRHFNSKDEILSELADTILTSWAEQAEIEKTATGDVGVRLARLIRGIYNEILESPYRAEFLLTEPAMKHSKLGSATRIYRLVQRTLDQMLDEGMEIGLFRRTSTEMSGHPIISLTDLFDISHSWRFP